MLAKDEYIIGEGGIAGAIERKDLDVLMMPTSSMTMSTFATKAESPVLSVPLGYYPPDTEVEYDPKNGLVTVAPNILKLLYQYFSRASGNPTHYAVFRCTSSARRMSMKRFSG